MNWKVTNKFFSKSQNLNFQIFKCCEGQKENDIEIRQVRNVIVDKFEGNRLQLEMRKIK